MFKSLLFITLFAISSFVHGHESKHDDPARDMVIAANNFIASLNEEEKNKAIFELKDDHREGWYFIPDKFIKPNGKRKGLLLKTMSPRQRLLSHALLASAMSSDGYRQATTIMTLEAILHEIENKNPIRDPELYYLSIFGKPGLKGSWGWRFEGHHLSINVAISEGKLYSVTPSFFGTNPAKTAENSGVLKEEQDIAFELVNSLTDEQKKLAILPGKAPADIITKQERVADRNTFLPVKGIPFSELTKEQQSKLNHLINSYASKYRHEILEEIDGRKKIHSNPQVHFAWAGGTKKGTGHYYRIQGKDFLFEYDNTQGGANHVHAVWRDFDGDFGRDLLKEHYDKKH